MYCNRSVLTWTISGPTTVFHFRIYTAIKLLIPRPFVRTLATKLNSVWLFVLLVCVWFFHWTPASGFKMLFLRIDSLRKYLHIHTFLPGWHYQTEIIISIIIFINYEHTHTAHVIYYMYIRVVVISFQARFAGDITNAVWVLYTHTFMYNILCCGTVRESSVFVVCKGEVYYVVYNIQLETCTAGVSTCI